jgi:hypothetical protein
VSEIAVFRPRAELDAAKNLAAFIEMCRTQLTVFGADLDFDADVWDITDTLCLKAKGGQRQRVVFNRLGNQVDDLARAPFDKAFSSFAKAYFRYMHGLRPTKTIGSRLSALRAFESALCESGGIASPIVVDSHILNRASQLIESRFSKALAYRTGSQLEILATFLTENRLTRIPINWRNPIGRPSDAVRIGKLADKAREKKLPSEAALDAIPRAFLLATKPREILVSSVAAILCSSPDRINEVLNLPENCEVMVPHGTNGAETYGLRWQASKGGGAMIKFIVPSMVTVVQKAIKNLRDLSKESRRIAAWYEANPGQVYLPDEFIYLRSSKTIAIEELCGLLGMVKLSSARAWCRRNAIKITGREKDCHLQFKDFALAILALLPKNFPFQDTSLGLRYSESLLVIRINELSENKSTNRCMIDQICVNQINDGLGARVSHGFSSIFTSLGLAAPDGSPIRISTHQFRHYLNTLAQAGGMSQLDIAKWSGRKDIRQNAVYDHETPEEIIKKLRAAVGNESTMLGPLGSLPRVIPIHRDEFSRLRIMTAHTTEIGLCVHDYSMTPCELFRDCINCEDFVFVKGDVEKTKSLRKSLAEARILLDRAEAEISDGTYGAERWYEHHKNTVDRLSSLCAILDDPDVADGTVIQLAPPTNIASSPSKLSGDVSLKIGSETNRTSK